MERIPHETLLAVKEYLDNNFRENIKMHHLMRMFHLNEKTLRYGFKKLYGDTPINYLTQKKLGCFVKLLLADDTSIGATAYESGFNNISTCNRAFKKYYKMTPTDWKEQQMVGKSALS